MLRRPPDMLITTPESLYLMLTSRARENLAGVRTLILDEVHAVAGTKRGAHLALTVERLERLTDEPFQRIGLSATQRPMEEIGKFVCRRRPIELVDAGRSKELDLRSSCPLEDMREPGVNAEITDLLGTGGGSRGQSIWPSIYPRAARARRGAPLDDRLRQQPPAGRAARASAQRAGGEGDRARPPRLPCARAAARGRGAAEARARSRASSPPRRSSSASTWAQSTSSSRSSRRSPSRAASSGSAAPGHALGAVSQGRSSRSSAPTCSSRPSSSARMLEGAIEETADPAQSARRPRAADRRDRRRRRRSRSTSCCALVRRAYPFADLSRVQLENVLDMLAGRYPSDEFAELRPRIVWDRTAASSAGASGLRRLAVTNAGTIPDRGLFGVHLVDGGGRVGELDEEMVYEARAGQTFMLGASTWRIEEITRDRVLVSPAPGVPGAIPFWKGEGPGRPYELGEAIGKASRELRRSRTNRRANGSAPTTGWTSWRRRTS